MSKALSSDVRSECIQVLMRCSEFKEINSLKSVFDVQGLCVYKAGLPEADEQTQRVRQTIAYLQEKSSEESPLLIWFLEELKSLNKGQGICEDLDRCISIVCEEANLGRKPSNIKKENIINIPFVIAAMIQKEAQELISGSAFNDPNTLKNDQEMFDKVKDILKQYKIENIESRYGEQREDWRPYLVSQDSIGKIIQDACQNINRINRKSASVSINESDDKTADEELIEVEPYFVSSEYFRDDEIQDKFKNSGVVLIMDDLSFFHPTLRLHLNKIISNERAAIIMLSTLSGRSLDQPFYDLIDDAIKIRLKEAHERYYNNLDPKCEICVDDLWSFRRWLSKILPEEAIIIGKKQPHPKSKKIVHDLLDDAHTAVHYNILGGGKKLGDRR